MHENNFKVLEWLRKIRDEHYEATKNLSWEEDHQEITRISDKVSVEIDKLKSQVSMPDKE